MAIASIESALSILESLSLKDGTRFAASTLARGRIHFAQDQHAQAPNDFRLCLSLYRKLMPPCHPSIARLLSGIAAVLSKLGRDAEAETFLDEAAALKRRSQTACSGPGCPRKLREDGAPLDVCVKCKCTFYCGKACQTADWKASHRAECKALRAKAAADTAVGER